LDFDAENNSIFENIDNNNGMTNPAELNVPDIPQEGNLLGNFINGIKNKVNQKKKEKEEQKLHNDLAEMFEENTETMLILKSFGCKMILRNINLMEISSEELNIIGFMKLEDGKAEPDEECKKLFEIISTIISGGYRIEDILNKYEEQEFYPIGEIEKVKIKFKGQEIEASKGTLANPKGEKRTIVFYRGYEITPDEE